MQDRTDGTAGTAVLKVAVALVFVAGAVSALTGAWFALADHPFTGPSQFSDEFGMRRAQLDAFNPSISSILVSDSARAGGVSIGWGVFVMVLAWLGLRRREKLALVALWAGGLPALTIAGLAEPVRFRTVEVGSVMSLAVLAVFVLGMALATRSLGSRAPDRLPRQDHAPSLGD
jgi:hypothetical protein